MRVVFWFIVVAGVSGCFHHQAHLPGVIDMRTDGNGLGAPERLKTTTDPKVVRPGAEGLVQGAGVLVNGRVVTVEDRHFWIFGSIPIYNESPAPELRAALDVGGALTEVEVGEEIDVIDIAASIFAPMVLPMASWVLPSHTFRMRAQATRPPSLQATPAPRAPSADAVLAPDAGAR